MKNANENQEDKRMASGNFSPGSKVQDFYPLHPNPSLTHETPMKPSQLQNRFPLHPPHPRRFLPFNSPDMHLRHPWRPPGQQHYHPCYPNNDLVRRADGENHPHYQHQRPQIPVIAVHPLRMNSHGGRFQSTPGHNTGNREKDPVSNSEQKEHSGQEGNTVKPGPIVLLKPVLKLAEPSVQLLNGSRRDSAPLQRSDSWTPSTSPGQALIENTVRRTISLPVNTTSLPVNSTTSLHNLNLPLILSNGTSHAKNSHHLSLKRRRESDSDDGNKKLCLQPTGPYGTLESSPANVLSPHSSSQKHLPDSELSPQTSNSQYSQTEPAHLNVLPPLPRKSCLKRTPMGAKQASIQSCGKHVVYLLSPSKQKDDVAKNDEECKNKSKRVSFNIPDSPSDSRSPREIPQAVENKTVDPVIPKQAAKPSTNPRSVRKPHRIKKPVIADDIQDLFTPDPTTYIVKSGHKTLKVFPDKSGSSPSDLSEPESPSPEVAEHETTPTLASDTLKFNIPDYIKISLPSVVLTRIPLPTTNERNKEEEEQRHIAEDVATPDRTSVSPSGTDEQSEEEEGLEDTLDLELDFNLDLDVASVSSSDSEDEQLVSLQEIMTKKDKEDKGTLAASVNEEDENHPLSVSSTKIGNYLDQILEDMAASKKAKETSTELLAACQEDLLRIAEYEEAESREENISADQRVFLQRFSLSSSAFREVPPGHEVFNLEKFGGIFTEDSLQLRHCSVSPQNTAQKTLLWSSHAQFKLYLRCGLIQEAFELSPCPFQITGFLFKMLSVQSDRLLSDKLLEVLSNIALHAADQRVNNGDERFKVWVPSLANITLVLMNMGAPFGTLFPLESLRPPFTESDLIEAASVKSVSSNTAPTRFPEHNCTNIFKYLIHCLCLCPRFYSDEELLLLLSLLCTVCLDSRLLLHRHNDLYNVLSQLLMNIRRWDDMMPKMCRALANLTDDHHNMCFLVQRLPHHSRALKLRQHLCLSMISKLLDGSCLYVPRSSELQLRDLRPYMSRLKPTSLLRTVMAAAQQNHSEGEEDTATPDQQAFYFCYSLLTLVNEATNFELFPVEQKEQLLWLCSELERHVKCHIREGERWLYRSKVKDLVARIYTKWQMMLLKTKPLHGQLYDYWQPLQGDVRRTQNIEEIVSSQERNPTVSDEDDDAEAEEEEEVIEIEEESKEAEGEEEETDDTDGVLNRGATDKRSGSSVGDIALSKETSLAQT